MRLRIPAVVSDLRTMPDTPECSVDGCLNGTNPDFDGFVCWGRRMDRLLWQPKRAPIRSRATAKSTQRKKDLMLIRYGYELTLNCPRPTTMVCLLDAGALAGSAL